MEDNTGSSESKKKSMEDNTRSSESKEQRRKTRSSESKEKRRKSMEDNTRSSESKEKKRKSMEDNTPTENLSYPPIQMTSRARSSPQMASPPLRWAGSSSPHVEPGQNIVLVRPKPLGNPTAPMEADEKIIEEKAVCKVCFAILREEENILKTKCKCSDALIHETCVADGDNCGNCQQKVQTFPVTLVRGLSNSTPVIKKKAKNVLGRFHG
ncbi:hypothetical protein LOK49_Contig623G00002 [Camellia lanceoleosa]|nr:hypothetical protein LOK49_Contig623G00002 [Camellia lanceoleosa]